jgi:hypothetical protein
LNKARDSSALNSFTSGDVQLFLKSLADGAAAVGRSPVKVKFTNAERKAVASYFRRVKSGLRLQSFVALSVLTGKPLTSESWSKLFDANKVGNLRFLIGGDPVKPQQSESDWQNKCFGLAEVKAGTFVVGLNALFFSRVSNHELSSPVKMD